MVMLPVATCPGLKVIAVAPSCWSPLYVAETL
jgi:hypothetical protein